MKQYLISVALVTAVFTAVYLSSSPVFADTTTTSMHGLTRDVMKMQTQASHEAVMQQNRLTEIIHRADTMITTRITALNTLSSRIQNDTRLSATEKTSLTTDMQTTITGLTTLKTKIDADTDPKTALSDTKQIITNYYVYAIFDPKVRLLVITNNMQTISANVQALVPQLQHLITTYQSQGKDVGQLQTLLTDISTQLQTINTTLTADNTKIQAVTSKTAATDAQPTFQQVRQDLSQIVHADFAKIQKDVAQMRPLFSKTQLAINK